ncbi:MAG: DUF4336 domain-containing protein [Myxococcales bacterium]|nr:DUF4336 domain-containing protein [Myxococcales bacterium]HIK84837.1 DUF4336 domain-containing protein [Myxococcales bacterium]
MRQLHPDLWITDSPLRFLGLEVGARMTIVRLPNSELLLHSPIAATEDLMRAVKALGTVTFLVAPNKLHHLFLGEWQRAFPEASTYVAPGLDTKRADLTITGILGDEPESGWKEVVDQVLMGGFPFVNEVVFFHRPSATLIATDLAFNISASSPPMTRLAFHLAGIYGRLAPTLLERLLVRDRTVFRQSFERILVWPFERVVVSHGNVSEEGGREELVRGYSWLFGQPRTP